MINAVEDYGVDVVDMSTITRQTMVDYLHRLAEKAIRTHRKMSDLPLPGIPEGFSPEMMTEAELLSEIERIGKLGISLQAQWEQRQTLSYETKTALLRMEKVFGIPLQTKLDG